MERRDLGCFGGPLGREVRVEVRTECGAEVARIYGINEHLISTLASWAHTELGSSKEGNR